MGVKDSRLTPTPRWYIYKGESLTQDVAVACTGDARLSCGGLDAVAIYSLIGIETQKSSDGGSDSSDDGNDQNNDQNNGQNNDQNNGGGKGSLAISLLPTTSGNDGLLSATDTPRKSATSGKTSLSSSPPSKTATGSGAAESAGSSGSNGGGRKSPQDQGQDQNQNQDQGQDQAPSGPPGRTVAAAVGGSMSGAVVLAGLLFLCFRAYRRKRARQDAHVKVILDHKNKKKHQDEKRRSQGNPPTLVLDDSHRDIHLTVDGVLVPTTPTLESGGGARRPSTVDDSLFRALMGDVRHGGGGGGGGVGVGGAGGGGKTITTLRDAGQSSAVQWRRGDGDGAVPPSPRVPFGNGMGGSGSGSGFGLGSPTTAAAAAAAAGGGAAAGAIIAGMSKSATTSPTSTPVARPEHAAKSNADLGDRAWHRRRISTPFPPQASPGPSSSSRHPPGITPLSPPPPPPPSRTSPASGGASVPVSALPPSAPLPPPRSIFASRGPPSGPPNMPLPPTPPVRPRRSFDTLDLSVGNNDTTATNRHRLSASSNASRFFGGRSPPPPLPPFPPSLRRASGGGNSVFGNAAASGSTPSLSSVTTFGSPDHQHNSYGTGGYDGSNNNNNMTSTPLYPSGSGGFRPTPPLKIRKQSEPQEHGGAGAFEWDDRREPTIPVLPPIRPGEKFDPQRWRGTIYAETQGDGDGGSSRGGDGENSGEASPLSATTVRTSILDSPTVGHWGMR